MFNIHKLINYINYICLSIKNYTILLIIIFNLLKLGDPNSLFILFNYLLLLI